MTHALHGPGAALLAAAAGWTVMMSVMMAPTVAPWIAAYHRIAALHRTPAQPLAATAAFAAGYLVVWGAFSIAAAFAHVLMPEPRHYAGVLLAGAGLFQLSPLKHACLSHCRNPLTFLLTRWKHGPASGFHLGVVHGAYCVGCCWALMLTVFAVGMSSVSWMAALALTTYVEQVSRWGARLRIPIGLALIAAGVSAA